MNSKTAIVLSNMGGPDSLEAVQPYLENIFLDPDIIDIPLPGFLRPRFARWLAGKRAHESREIYRKIGNKTPLTDISMQVAQRLEDSLNRSLSDVCKVFIAMRYWAPLLEDVWDRILSEGFDKIIIVTQYPFYSSATTGSLLNLVQRLHIEKPFPGSALVTIDRFGSHPGFISAMAGQITDAMAVSDQGNEEPTHLLLSAHSIPQKLVRKGDPYRDEIEAAFNLLRKLLPENIVMHLSFQSKLGPVKWLEPSTPDKLRELASSGVSELFVYPFGFVADNSETVYEIGMLHKEIATTSGIRRFTRIDALNTDHRYIDVLRDIIMEQL